MVGRKTTIVPDLWIETGRRILVEEGAAEVKIDRLAKRLGVSRGGFYHHFRTRAEFMAELLSLWERTCQFLPQGKPGRTPAEAKAWIELSVERLIAEDGYDPLFDMAVRAWARFDQMASWAIERADRQRIDGLEAAFQSLGYSGEQARIRARVFYYHQIGFYAVGTRESFGRRRRDAHVYVDILADSDTLARARGASVARRGRRKFAALDEG
ncbi:TetR/AcrR family transcriptional regulator [Sphingopyxis terrae]|uniref:TetR/AcrR family transcriptional regulator n=1 Tax=Sphingopyxis terrae TaxID=33052 RepID=UPI002A155FDB|nr:helix-turn-helix domain-containing protein [Sphingopyxis terrae]MDX8356514.1 helix-turn-helix domain-containing protein [Sphingopyxis terrae]